jgi:hypothetical protein
VNGGPILDDLDFGQHQAGDVATLQPHDKFSVTCNSPVSVQLGVDQGQHFVSTSICGPLASRNMAKPGVATTIPYLLDVGIGVSSTTPGGGGTLINDDGGVPTGSGETNMGASANGNSNPTYYIDITARLCDTRLPAALPPGLYEDLLTINLVW